MEEATLRTEASLGLARDWLETTTFTATAGGMNYKMVFIETVEDTQARLSIGHELLHMKLAPKMRVEAAEEVMAFIQAGSMAVGFG